MLNPRDALETLGDVWSVHRAQELPRLDRIDQALKVDPPLNRREFIGEPGRGRYAGGFRPTVAIPDDAPPIMWELARKARTNYLPLLVRVFRQALRVEGYHTAAPEAENPWRWWRANRLNARQLGIHDSALKYGCAYVHCGLGESGPWAKAFTPRRLTAVYADPEVDEWPLLAAYVDANGSHIVLLDEEAEYRFGIEEAAGVARLIGGAPAASIALGADMLTFIEAKPHGVGTCPVVRYRDSFLLDGEEQFGVVEPLMVIQERIDETAFGQLVAQYFAAFKQRAVIGWVPESEAEELKAGAARIWYLDVDKGDVDIKELSETDLTRYIESGKSARRDFAAVGQIPAGDLGVEAISNISDATLSGLERAKNNRAGEIATSLGESHEQTLRLMAHLAGDETAAADLAGEVRWAEREARTWAGQIDGLVKLVQAQVLTPDTAVDHVPGLSETQVEVARADAARARGAAFAEAFATGATNAPAAVGASADDMKARFDALGIAIRAGVDPDDAAARVGLPGVKFTGAVPVSLRLPDNEAAQVEDR